jgi:hypothetical protein
VTCFQLLGRFNAWVKERLYACIAGWPEEV